MSTRAWASHLWKGQSLNDLNNIQSTMCMTAGISVFDACLDVLDLQDVCAVLES